MTYIPTGNEKDRRKKFGERLAKARDALGITQDQLAGRIGCGPQTISNWERGYYFPDKVDTLLKLADKLRCDPDYLLDRLDESSHDIHYVHEITGLSENAIKKLQKEKNQTVSQFIENPRFLDFIRCFGEYCNLLNSIKSYEQYENAEEEMEIELDSGQRVKLPYSLALSLFEQRLTNSLIVLCQRAMRERISELIRMDQKKK